MSEIDELLDDLNGGIIVIKSEHECVHLNIVETGEGYTELNDGADLVLLTERRYADFAIVQLPRRKPPEYRQADPRWADLKYSSSGMLTFRQAGCLVCCLASLASWAYDLEILPPSLAQVIAANGAFEGDYISHPDRISGPYPELTWTDSSFINWRTSPADIELLRELLRDQPVILEVDYNPQTPKIDQHFVLAYDYVEALDEQRINDNLLVMDPLTGHTTTSTYFNPDWLNEWMLEHDVSRVARTIIGARIWRVKK